MGSRLLDCERDWGIEGLNDGGIEGLDITNPRLPLKSGPIQEFPYNNIKGYGYPFTYQRKPEPQNAIGRLFWNKEGKIVRH